MADRQMSMCVTVVCILLCACALNSASPLAMYYKKSVANCVAAAGKCFNAEECCPGFTCAAQDDSGDDESLELPGTCIRSKNLSPCMTIIDCDPAERCVALSDSIDTQRYCLPAASPASPSQSIQSLQLAPGQHHAYSKLLADRGGSCTTSADCQPYSEDEISGKVGRLCCQQVRRGRQGIRHVCDNVTPISICIPPPAM